MKLVWSEAFPTREEARKAELQLKGWGRSKKLALIRCDWNRISVLAKGNKEGASTSSAKPGVFVDSFLHPHLNQLPSEPLSLQAGVRADVDRLAISFRLTGPLNHLAIPPPGPPARRDELWRHTCFEAFVELDGGPGYLEFNFSPSTEWAAYQFGEYRNGMTALDLDLPSLRCTRSRFALELTAAVRIPRPFVPTRLALCAVIEEASGCKSYWALAHPTTEPDFHHPEGFVVQLPSS